MQGSDTEKYKDNCDDKVCRKSQICVGDKVYIDCSQHATFASDSAMNFDQQEFEKLGRRMHRPYMVLEVQPQIFSIKENGIVNRVSIDTMPVQKSPRNA